MAKKLFLLATINFCAVHAQDDIAKDAEQLLACYKNTNNEERCVEDLFYKHVSECVSSSRFPLLARFANNLGYSPVDQAVCEDRKWKQVEDKVRELRRERKNTITN